MENPLLTAIEQRTSANFFDATHVMPDANARRKACTMGNRASSAMRRSAAPRWARRP